MYCLLLKPAKIQIISILITHPINFDCIMTNNPSLIVYDRLIGLTITRHFLKWVHQLKHRVHHVQGYDNIPNWLYAVVDWCSLPESGRFTTLWRSIPEWSAEPCYCSAAWRLLILWNANCVFSKTDVDKKLKNKVYVIRPLLRKLTKIRTNNNPRLLKTKYFSEFWSLSST